MSPRVVRALLAVWAIAGCDKRSLSKDLRDEARAAVREGRSAVAANALERALAFDPEDERARRALATLYVDEQRYQDALATLGAGTVDASADDPAENLRVRAEAGLGWLERASQRARALQRRDALEPGTQAELSTALTRALARHEDGQRFEDLPPPWRRDVILRLLAGEEIHTAARLTVSLPRSEERIALRDLVLERERATLHLSPELLRALTEDPRSAPSYRARLEALLALGDVAAAQDLELQRPQLNEDANAEWQLRWARHFASRSEWLSVLDTTRSEAGSIIDRANRYALRCTALLRLQQPRAAMREMRAWLASSSSPHWHNALMQEALRAHEGDLQELRWQIAPIER